MYGYIYLTTNLINNKKYIGQHRSTEFDKNYYGSGIIFKKALEKYGKQNFKVEILYECDSEEDLNLKEIYFINLYNAVKSKDFYNTNYGGYRNGNKLLVFVYNPKTNITQMIDPSELNNYLSQGYVAGMKPRTEEQIKNYINSWEHRGKILVTNDEETKYILEKDVENYLQNGYRLGRIPTRPNQKQECRKWINDGVKSFMVKQEEIETYLSKGYKLGRLKFSSFVRTASAHNKGKIMIHKDSNIKYINKEDLDSYLKDGWVENKHKNK